MAMVDFQSLSRLDRLRLQAFSRNPRAAIKHIDAESVDGPQSRCLSVCGDDRGCMEWTEGATDFRDLHAPNRNQENRRIANV